MKRAAQAYRDSPAGKRAAKDRHREVEAKQARIDALMAELPAVVGDEAELMEWLGKLASDADDRDVRFNRGTVLGSTVSGRIYPRRLRRDGARGHRGGSSPDGPVCRRPGDRLPGIGNAAAPDHDEVRRGVQGDQGDAMSKPEYRDHPMTDKQFKEARKLYSVWSDARREKPESIDLEECLRLVSDLIGDRLQIVAMLHETQERLVESMERGDSTAYFQDAAQFDRIMRDPAQSSVHCLLRFRDRYGFAPRPLDPPRDPGPASQQRPETPRLPIAQETERRHPGLAGEP